MKAMRYFLIVIVAVTFCIISTPSLSESAAEVNARTLATNRQAKANKAKKQAKEEKAKKKAEEKEKEQKRLEYVRDYEPSGKGKFDKVNEYIKKFSQISRFDPRIDHFDVTAEVKDKTVYLKGAVINEGQKSGVVDLLEQLLFKSVNADELIVLPDPALGENTWGLVSVPVLGQYKDLRDRRSRLNEYTYGSGIRILMKSEDGKSAFIFGPEGYLGWAPMNGILEVPLKVWQQSKRGPYAFMKESVVVNPETGDVRVTDWNLSEEELKSLVAFPKSSIQLMNHKGEIVLVDGRTVRIDKSLYEYQDPAADPRREKILAVAKSFLGTPCLYGGKSEEGMDSSGLTLIAYEAVGIPLSRDSSHQVIGGEIVGTCENYDAALPGDIIFFTRHPGKIFHVGLYMHDGQFIQSSGRYGVSIFSLNPEDSNYTGYMAPKVTSIRRYLR